MQNTTWEFPEITKMKEFFNMSNMSSQGNRKACVWLNVFIWIASYTDNIFISQSMWHHHKVPVHCNS